MPEKYIISHDMGTSSAKALLVSVHGKIIDSAKATYDLYHPKSGYAEQDPLDWWQAIITTTQEVLHKTNIDSRNIAGITFSSQTMSLIPVDEQGQPLTRAMTWLDTRGAQLIHDKLWTAPRIMGYNIFHLLRFLRITGGSPGHTGKDQIAKMLWLRYEKPELFKQVYKFLDAKDFIIHKLTGNFVASSDIAYIWWLADTRRYPYRWHPGLCRLAGIRVDQLPEIRHSAAVAGNLSSDAARVLGLQPGTPVINGSGDLSSAALGSGALNEGELHIRIGTSGGVAGHFTKRKIDLAHYAGCIGSTYPKKYYLGIAHQETAGLCLEWLRQKVLYHEQQLMDEEQVGNIYQVLDQLAESAVPGANGLMFTPWMFGERCPLDNDTVRGGLFNVGLDHSREHIVRAVLEGIAFNTRWAMETLEKLYQPVKVLHIIGGGARSGIWCQIMADITNRKINQINRPQEASARGIALLASLTLGYVKSYHDIQNYIKIDQQFLPNPDNRILYDRLFKEFKNIYKQNKRWYKRMNRPG